MFVLSKSFGLIEHALILRMTVTLTMVETLGTQIPLWGRTQLHLSKKSLAAQPLRILQSQWTS
jgi:hypothetical protein